MGQHTLHMNPGGIQETAGQIGTSMGNVDTLKANMLAEGKKQLANLDGGAGSAENQAVFREYERRVDELIRSGRAGQTGAQNAAEHGQAGMQRMRSALGQSAV